ncbi:hypothetical protein F5141DRAFT_973508, partial [Pisolithus sp. B1]
AEKTSIIVGPTDHYLSSALVHYGLILCSPITPKVAIAVNTLHLYHIACQHCPHLLIQAYVKLLCDMHGVCQRFVLLHYTYSCHDPGSILQSPLLSIFHSLRCDQPDWWLKHCCPACTYKLQDKPAM